MLLCSSYDLPNGVDPTYSTPPSARSLGLRTRSETCARPGPPYSTIMQTTITWEAMSETAPRANSANIFLAAPGDAGESPHPARPSGRPLECFCCTFAAWLYRVVVMQKGAEVRSPRKCARVRAVRCHARKICPWWNERRGPEVGLAAYDFLSRLKRRIATRRRDLPMCITMEWCICLRICSMQAFAKTHASRRSTINEKGVAPGAKLSTRQLMKQIQQGICAYHQHATFSTHASCMIRGLGDRIRKRIPEPVFPQRAFILQTPVLHRSYLMSRIRCILSERRKLGAIRLARSGVWFVKGWFGGPGKCVCKLR